MYINNENTPKLFPDFFHLGMELDAENRWLKLSGLIPWERLAEAYGAYFSETGRPAMDARLVCGLFIIKQLKNLSDEDAVAELRESPYLQAFCGYDSFVKDGLPSPSLLSERRRRLGEDFFSLLEGEVGQVLRKQKYVRPRRDQVPEGWLCNAYVSVQAFLRGLLGK
ncbi:MAG TPA: hypothetical protein DDW67_01780 [Elusimicrobia bacterium]|nr:hypothetical protein [Elusimicrobiota bacterium]